MARVISTGNCEKLMCQVVPKLCTFLLDLYGEFSGWRQNERNGTVTRCQQWLTELIKDDVNNY